MELNEQQFGILKQLVHNNVFFIMLLDVLPTDPTEMHKNHVAYLETLNPMVEMGFIENITEKFKESVTEIKAARAAAIEAGEDLPAYERGFQAYALTETAIRTFAPSAGAVN